MSDSIIELEKKLALAHSRAVRQVNHVKHHPVDSSRTLMRQSVSRPEVSSKRHLKAHSITHAPALHIGRTSTIRPDRHHRAERVEKSQFISHFARLDSRGFASTSAQHQPIHSIVHKPEVKKEQNNDELLYKAMEKLSNDLKELEQLPIKRLHSFAKHLVSNRFNQVAAE